MSKVDSNLDVLFDVRNNFYLGNYQQCVNAAQNLRVVGDADKTTKDVFLYRAYIAQNNFGIPLDEISSSTTNLPLLAIRLFATYLSKNATDRSAVLEEVEKKLASGTIVDDYFHVIVAQIYMREQNYESALRVLHQTETLEGKALTIQCLLNINRVDLALKDMKKMQDTDEDATITQLTLALVNTAIGKEKLQDAFYIYQEMMDKYGETPLLLVSQASCLIMQQKYSDAEKLLLEALQRDANNAEALINMIVCGQFLGKAPEVSNRYVNQLKQFHPNHAWVRDCESKERLFDRIVQQSTSASA